MDQQLTIELENKALLKKLTERIRNKNDLIKNTSSKTFRITSNRKKFYDDYERKI